MTELERLELLDAEHEAVEVMLRTPTHSLVDAMDRVIFLHDLAEGGIRDV